MVRGLSLATLALAICCFGWSSVSVAAPLISGKIVVIEGRVSTMDFSARPVDGDGLIAMQTEKHGEIMLHIPSGEAQCAVTTAEVVDTLRKGDRIRATATVEGPSHIKVCGQGTRLEKIR
jgi:hypothetical protein